MIRAETRKKALSRGDNPCALFQPDAVCAIAGAENITARYTFMALDDIELCGLPAFLRCYREAFLP